MTVRMRKVVPHGGQHPVADEWYDDETMKIVPAPQSLEEPPVPVTEADLVQPEPEPEVEEDAEPSEPTEAPDAGGGDAGTDEPEVPYKPTRRRKRSKAEPTDGDGSVSAETD